MSLLLQDKGSGMCVCPDCLRLIYYLCSFFVGAEKGFCCPVARQQLLTCFSIIFTPPGWTEAQGDKQLECVRENKQVTDSDFDLEVWKQVNYLPLHTHTQRQAGMWGVWTHLASQGWSFKRMTSSPLQHQCALKERKSCWTNVLQDT